MPKHPALIVFSRKYHLQPFISAVRTVAAIRLSTSLSVVVTYLSSRSHTSFLVWQLLSAAKMIGFTSSTSAPILVSSYGVCNYLGRFLCHLCGSSIHYFFCFFTILRFKRSKLLFHPLNKLFFFCSFCFRKFFLF